MKKQITLFIFMVLVTMIIFLKRMNAMEGRANKNQILSPWQANKTQLPRQP